jgi:hypothetical protein
MFRPLAAAAVAALALAACATPTVYGPISPASHGVGYSEYRIENNRYRVTFQGGPGAPERQVADYALYRAAEITLRDGYDWFQVVDRFGGPTSMGGGSRMSVGTGGGSWGRHSSFGVGVGTSFDLSGGPAFANTIEFIEGRGARPADPHVYDARALTASLAPNAPLPPAPGY